MMVRPLASVACCIALAAAACSSAPPPDPIQLSGRQLIVDNRTDDDWSDVAIWLNHHYRIVAPRIRAGSRFTAPLDTFVAGFGQRFQHPKQPVTDVRVEGKRPDGSPFELRRTFGGGAGSETR